MTRTAQQLSLDFGGGESTRERKVESRREERQSAVRLVKFTRFPRTEVRAKMRVGYTRDVSASGMALGTDGALPVGSLLHVIVHSVDGRPTLNAIARVAWCRNEPPDGDALSPGTDLRAWMGLVILAEVEKGMARTRPYGGLEPLPSLNSETQ